MTSFKVLRLYLQHFENGIQVHAEGGLLVRLVFRMDKYTFLHLVQAVAVVTALRLDRFRAKRRKDQTKIVHFLAHQVVFALFNPAGAGVEEGKGVHNFRGNAACRA